MAQKVPVVTQYGNSTIVGYVTPAIGYQTNFGLITDIVQDDNVLLVGSGTSETQARVYASHAQILLDDVDGIDFTQLANSGDSLYADGIPLQSNISKRITVFITGGGNIIEATG